MSEKGDGLKTNPAWVPQLFFDIIGRLVPGTVVIGILYVSIVGLEAGLQSARSWLTTPAASYPAITIIAAVNFVLAYTLAMILMGFCSLAGGILLNLRNPLRWLLATFGSELRIRSKEEVKESAKQFSKNYDRIKREDAAAGNRITKLHAEIHMAEILTSGFVLSITAMSLGRVWNGPDRYWWYLLILLLLAVLGSVAARYHIATRRRLAVENLIELIGKPQGTKVRNLSNASK